MASNEIIKKKEQIRELLFSVVDCYEVNQYFDMDSDKLLDEKIAVLEALKEGKAIKDIPNFYDVLELLTKEGAWD